MEAGVKLRSIPSQPDPPGCRAFARVRRRRRALRRKTRVVFRSGRRRPRRSRSLRAASATSAPFRRPTARDRGEGEQLIACPAEAAHKHGKSAVRSDQRRVAVRAVCSRHPSTSVVPASAAVGSAAATADTPVSQIRDVGHHVVMPGLVDTTSMSTTRDSPNGKDSPQPARRRRRRHHHPRRHAAEQRACDHYARGLEEKLGRARISASTCVLGRRGPRQRRRSLGACSRTPGCPGFKCFLSLSGVDEFEHCQNAPSPPGAAIPSAAPPPAVAHAEFAAALKPVPAASDPRGYATGSTPVRRPRSTRLRCSSHCALGTPIHVVHLAAAEAVPMLRAARAEGRRTKMSSPEYPALPHVLRRTDPRRATESKCAPPIRGRAHRDALWRALVDGDADARRHGSLAVSARDEGRWRLLAGGRDRRARAVPRAVWSGASARGVRARAPRRMALRPPPARRSARGESAGSLEPGRRRSWWCGIPTRRSSSTSGRLVRATNFTPYHGLTLRGRVRRTPTRRGRVVRDGDRRRDGGAHASGGFGSRLGGREAVAAQLRHFNRRGRPAQARDRGGVPFADEFTDRGKWMDGWETGGAAPRVTTGASCASGCRASSIRVTVDTAFFRRQLIRRIAGSTAAACRRARTRPPPNIRSGIRILERSELSRRHEGTTFAIPLPAGGWSAVSPTCASTPFPDGGVARLRVLGEVDATTGAGSLSRRGLNLTADGARQLRRRHQRSFNGEPRDVLMPLPAATHRRRLGEPRRAAAAGAMGGRSSILGSPRTARRACETQHRAFQG